MDDVLTQNHLGQWPLALPCVQSVRSRSPYMNVYKLHKHTDNFLFRTGATYLGRMLKLANRQMWAATCLLTALQVKALFTQDCSQTHCTPQVLLDSEGELYCWILVGWTYRAPWEPWSCMSVPWSLPHLLSVLPPTRGTPGSLGLAPRSPLLHQSNCQYHNQVLPHKEVHHQSPGSCCCSFCRKITRKTGCHQRRVCSLGVRASNRDIRFLGSILALLNKTWDGTKKDPVCLFVCFTICKTKSDTSLPHRQTTLFLLSLLFLLLTQKQSALYTDNTIPALRHLQGYRSWNIVDEEVFSFLKVAGLIIIHLVVVPHLV